MNKTLIVLCYLLLPLCILTACSGRQIELTRWEGIEKDTLRVYVRIEYTEQNTSLKKNQFALLIQQEAQSRGKILLNAYAKTIQPQLPSSEIAPVIAQVLSAPVIRIQKETDDYEEGFVEFAIQPFMQKLSPLQKKEAPQGAEPPALAAPPIPAP